MAGSRSGRAAATAEARRRLHRDPQRLNIDYQACFLRANPSMRLCALLLATLGIGSLAAGCGPSLTTIHEGSLRFEHCYRIDLEPDANSPQRNACWSRWLAQYTYGQPRDRIDYARRRMIALEEGNAQAPELRLTGGHGAEERQFYVVAPAPQDLHGPPPPLATALDAASVTASTDSAREPPASPCAKSCGSTWSTCDASCVTSADTAVAGSAGANAAPPSSKAASGKAAGGKAGVGGGCEACASAYASCMRGCFE